MCFSFLFNEFDVRWKIYYARTNICSISIVSCFIGF